MNKTNEITQEISFCNNDLNDELFDTYKNSQYLAIDTEAMGLVHGRDRLCLIQICNESNVTSCIKLKKILNNQNGSNIFLKIIKL